MAGFVGVIWVSREAVYFFGGDWTGQITLKSLQKINFPRRAMPLGKNDEPGLLVALAPSPPMDRPKGINRSSVTRAASVSGISRFFLKFVFDLFLQLVG